MSWVATGGNFIAINGIDVPILKDKLIILFFDDQNLDGVVRVTNASLYIYMLTMSCLSSILARMVRASSLHAYNLLAYILSALQGV